VSSFLLGNSSGWLAEVTAAERIETSTARRKRKQLKINWTQSDSLSDIRNDKHLEFSLRDFRESSFLRLEKLLRRLIKATRNELDIQLP